MADPRLFRLRVRYAKSGRLALLSHLEVARALERAVRRAGLPFAVTNGFSPHMRIAFGAALPVGVGGIDEFFDLYLTDYVAPEKALAALAAVSPADLMPHGAAYVEPMVSAASVACPLSAYRVTFDGPIGRALVVPEQVEVVRKKKRKVLVVDDFLVGDIRACEDGCAVEFTLEAKPTGSLRPDVLVEAMVAKTEAGASSGKEQAAGAGGNMRADASAHEATCAPLPAVRSIVRISQK